MLSRHPFVQRRKLELREAKPPRGGKDAGSVTEPGLDLQVSGFRAVPVIITLSSVLMGKLTRGEGRDLFLGISGSAGRRVRAIS